jgi:hypothetical protein
LFLVLFRPVPRPSLLKETGFMEFKTKKDEEDYYRRMLAGYADGERVSVPDTSDLAALVLRHPHAREKIGAGISHFTAGPSIYKSRCFFLHRIDGTFEDVSYLTCIRKPTSARSDVIAAMRQEIQDDVLDAKRKYFLEHADEEERVRCGETGELITYDEAHADHALPLSFNVLATLFLAARKIEPSFEIIARDGQFGCALADRTLALEWKQFHHANAHIRIISRSANSALARFAKPRAQDCQLKLPDPGDLQ